MRTSLRIYFPDTGHQQTFSKLTRYLEFSLIDVAQMVSVDFSLTTALTIAPEREEPSLGWGDRHRR